MNHHPARDFVLALDLPDAPPQLESVEAPLAFSDQPESVAVGTQLAQLSVEVAPATRTAVADCLLLAQLAANKAAGAQPDVMAWYRKYVEVLQSVGWTVQSLAFQTKQIGNLEGGVHQAIVPVVTAMLGPAVAAATMVVAVLEGLQQMDAGNPWITAFNRASQHVSGAKFQLGFVGADADGNPQVNLLALAIDAHKTITQVLFFKFSDQGTTLATADGHFGIDAARLDSIKDAVAARVQPFITDFVAKIDL